MRMLTAGCSSLLECINLFSCFLIPGEGTLEAPARALAGRQDAKVQRQENDSAGEGKHG